MSKDTVKVDARTINLADGRSVSLGKSSQDPGSFYLRFTNPEVGTTELKLSTEAMESLVHLFLGQLHREQKGTEPIEGGNWVLLANVPVPQP